MAKRKPASANEGYQRPLRDKQLITLDDQGSTHNLPVALFHFDGRDQTWNSHVDSFMNANRPLLSAIDVEPRLAPSLSEVRLDLRSGGSIGAVPLLAPDTMKIMGGVVVRPRFGWDGVGSVLSRIGWSAAPSMLAMPMVPGSAREVPPWVLAGPVLARLRRMLLELKRGFLDKEEVRQTPRGQILWQHYVSRELPQGSWHQIPCRFPELSYDPHLRSYIRWGLEQLYRSLAPYTTTDVIAGSLAEQAKELLLDIPETLARYPEKRILRSILHGSGLPTRGLSLGVEALLWLVDERGLAGTAEQDGLSWVLPMSDLFEKWLGHLVSEWAKAVGGSVSMGYRGQTLVPLDWERHTFNSLNSLVPDIVVRVADRTYVFDAKYKGQLDDMDERRWSEEKDELYEQHRHDIHQVLAYASLYGTTDVTAVLAYPMRLASWQRLAVNGHTEMQASIYQDNRNMRLILLGVPLHFTPGDLNDRLLHNWMNVL